jgi:hypothetical protein
MLKLWFGMVVSGSLHFLEGLFNHLFVLDVLDFEVFIRLANLKAITVFIFLGNFDDVMAQSHPELILVVPSKFHLFILRRE